MEELYMLPLGQLHQILGCALAARASIFCGLLLDGPELKIGFYRIWKQEFTGLKRDPA
jgi:hypothetical protein